MKKNFFKRSSSDKDEKSQLTDVKPSEVKQIEKNYKEYDLEVESDFLCGVTYYINIYAGTKRLRFVLDSGATTNAIANRFLRGLPHFNTGTRRESCSVSGIMTERIVLLGFGLEPNYTPDEAFCMEFGALTRKHAPFFNEDSVGLLGATFLQFCEVDFRNAKIRVYQKSREAIAADLASLEAVLETKEKDAA